MVSSHDGWKSGSGAEDHEWIYLGNSKISGDEGTKSIRISDGVFEKGIIDHPDENSGQDVHWAYETGSGLLIISREKLKGEPLGGTTVARSQVTADGGKPESKYKSQGSTTQQGASNSYSATVPKQFFRDYKGHPEQHNEVNGRVPEYAQIDLDKDRERHFLTRRAFLNAPKKPCFVLSTDQLTKIIGSYRDLQDSVARIPNFLKD